jgi:hypothetical protein
MNNTDRPVQLHVSRRRFIFLGLGVLASGALDPWGLFAGTDDDDVLMSVPFGGGEVLRYTYDKSRRTIDVSRVSARMIRRLDQLRHESHEAVVAAIHHEADQIMDEARARSLQLDSYYRWGVRL